MGNTPSISSSDFKFHSYDNTQAAPLPSSPLSVKQDATWTYIGPLLHPSSLPAPLLSFAAQTINGDFQSHLTPFLFFANSYLANSEIDHYWLTVRVSKPTSDYDLPRWHTDRDAMISTKKAVRWKLATTLTGPGTLFQAKSKNARAVMKKVRKETELEQNFADHHCTSIRCLGCSDLNEIVRKRLAQELDNMEVARPGRHACCWFRTGEEEGAVHSEPRCDDDRIFVNVTPGTEEQIRELASFWGMEMPRMWVY
jgi:hypothetical protein